MLGASCDLTGLAGATGVAFSCRLRPAGEADAISGAVYGRLGEEEGKAGNFGWGDRGDSRGVDSRACTYT